MSMSSAVMAHVHALVHCKWKLNHDNSALGERRVSYCGLTSTCHGMNVNLEEQLNLVKVLSPSTL